MATNRYTDITPAVYDPMSMQEIMMAPMLKRKQHDQVSADLSALDAELAKIDPLEVHTEYAKAERAKLADQIQQQAETLASQGYNNNTASNLLKFNRQFQETISPTGSIGRVNNAKKVYLKNFEDYIENATKNKGWSREDAIRNWNQYEKQNYTGFDSEGNVVNIGQFGAPEKVDLMQKLKDVKSILGEQVVKEISNGNYSFARQEDGSLAVVNKNGRRIETSNAPNIQNALNMLQNELYDPNSAWSQSIKFEGLDPTSYVSQINSGMNAMLTNKVTDNRTQSISFAGVKNTKDIEEESNIPSVTEPVTEFNTGRANLSSSLSKIGTEKSSKKLKQYIGRIGSTGPGGFYKGDTSGDIFTEKDLSKSELQEYDVMYNAMVNSGLIDKSKPKFAKENITQIQQYIDNTKDFSYSNKILKPTAVDNDLQKPLVFTPKKGYDMSTHLTQEVSSGRRTMIDKNTQEKIDLKDYPGAKIEYVGMVSPSNVLTKNDKTTLNDDSFVIPHVVQIVYKDGNVEKRKEVYMDRDAEEMKKPEFKASKVIKNVTLNGKKAPGLINKYSGSELGDVNLKEIQTQYVPEQNGYIVKYTAKNGGDFMKTDGNGQPLIISEEQLQNEIYEVYNKASKK